MRHDATGQLRILTKIIVIAKLACSAFSAIARYGTSDADVITRLVNTMDKLSRLLSPSARKAITALSEQLLIAIEHGASLSFDREAVQDLRGRQRF